jgi:hypothetical protein
MSRGNPISSRQSSKPLNSSESKDRKSMNKMKENRIIASVRSVSADGLTRQKDVAPKPYKTQSIGYIPEIDDS